MCLDEVDNKGNKINKNLYGLEGNKHRSIDIAAIPCIPKQLTKENRKFVDQECIADYENPDGKYGLNKKL